MRNPIHHNRRRKLCGRKVSYLTREAGAYAMIALANNTGAAGLNVYRCKDCNEFHVGHPPIKIKTRYGLLFGA